MNIFLFSFLRTKKTRKGEDKKGTKMRKTKLETSREATYLHQKRMLGVQKSGRRRKAKNGLIWKEQASNVLLCELLQHITVRLVSLFPFSCLLELNLMDGKHFLRV